MFSDSSIKFFTIADFNICIYTKSENVNLQIDENYQAFKANSNEDNDICIEVKIGIKSSILNANKVFSASHSGGENDEAYFWSVHKSEDKYIIISSDPGARLFPCLALIFSKTKSLWEMYVSEEYLRTNNKVDPFLYPMGPLILYYLSAFNNAIMLHASAVDFLDKAFVFTGKSGIGKTTMAKIWNQNGAKIINDDRIVIREQNGKYIVYNTPMYYPDPPKKATLNAIFILNQGLNNSSVQLKGTSAISNLLVNCIQHDYDKTLINSHIDLIEGISSSIPIYNLNFRPDNSIFEFIQYGAK